MQIELAVSRATNILQSAAGDTVQWLFNWRRMMITATQSASKQKLYMQYKDDILKENMNKNITSF